MRSRVFESNEIHLFYILFWYFSATPVKINWVFTCGVDIELSGVDSGVASSPPALANSGATALPKMLAQEPPGPPGRAP